METFQGEERRVSQDEQLGYIRGKVESLADKLGSHIESEDGRIKAIEDHIHANTKSLKAIEKSIDLQANTHRYIWLAVKSIAGAIFLAITVRFGDLINLLK